MDETHIILLLAVIAVLVLAVAVVILLPKEKIAPASSDEDKNKKKTKQPQKKKSKASVSTVPPSQKSTRIKGFSDVQDVDDTSDLEEYLRIKNKPTILAKEEKKAKPKPTAEVRNVALEDDGGEDYIKIKRERENKKKANSKEEKQEEKKKRKKPFFKPEIVQGMIEGRKKDREERKNKEGHEGVEGEDDKKKKKKDTKSEEGAKKEETNAEGQKTDDKKQKKERPPKTDKGEQQPQQRKERPPRTDSPRPPRPAVPRAPAPIRNTGLEPASLDAMLSAITHYYAETPNVFKKLDKEIIVRLLQFLPLKDIITLTKVNKYFRAFIKKEESLWAALCARDFAISKKLPNSKSFKHTYKVSYQNAHPKK